MLLSSGSIQGGLAFKYLIKPWQYLRLGILLQGDRNEGELSIIFGVDIVEGVAVEFDYIDLVTCKGNLQSCSCQKFRQNNVIDATIRLQCTYENLDLTS